MKKLMPSLVTLAASAWFATGCQPGPYAPNNTAHNGLEDTAPVVLMDGMVQRLIAAPKIQETPLADGRLKIVCNIRNLETRRIQVQVRCIFKDVNGFSTNDETPWTDLILTENSEEGVSFTSLNNLAKKYTVSVRQAH